MKRISNKDKARVLSCYLPYFVGTPMILAIIKTIEKYATMSGDLDTIRTRFILKDIRGLSADDSLFILKVRYGKKLHTFSHSVRLEALDLIIRYIVEGDLAVHPDIIDYLRLKGYDIPHFLLNGKTLEQAGLAVYEVKPKLEMK